MKLASCLSHQPAAMPNNSHLAQRALPPALDSGMGRVRASRPSSLFTREVRPPFYTVSFAPGPIGLVFETDFYAMSLVVKTVVEPGQAYTAGSVQPGDVLHRANGAALDGKPFDEIMRLLRELPRPLCLEFEKPSLRPSPSHRMKQAHKELSASRTGRGGGSGSSGNSEPCTLTAVFVLPGGARDCAEFEW